MTDDESWPVSRRQLLAGVSAVGAAAATGAGTGAFLRDSRRTEARLSSGTLDLDVRWVDDGSHADFGTLGEAGDGGSGRVAVSAPADSNPAYVWFRTNCERCTEMERKLEVALRLETGDGRSDVLRRGTLDEVRRRLAEGERLGRLSPGETWYVDVEWELQRPLTRPGEVDFDFDFHAAQARNVDDPATVGPAWTCPDGPCSEGGSATQRDISWVGFCADGDDLSRSQVEFEVDGPALHVVDAPATLGAVVLKYGRKLDVFASPATRGTFVAGDGDRTFDQRQSGFLGTDRSNREPCPGECGFKYEVDTDSFEPSGCDQ